jgi:hypothetical protein
VPKHLKRQGLGFRFWALVRNKSEGGEGPARKEEKKRGRRRRSDRKEEERDKLEDKFELRLPSAFVCE